MLKLTLYFLATLLLGALLAPMLLAGGQWFLSQAAGAGASWAEWAPVKGLIAEIHKASFERYFARAVMIVALALLWPLARWLHIGGWRSLGLEKDPRWAANLALGFFVAAGGLLLMGWAFTEWGWVKWRRPLPWASAWPALGTGLIVGFLEEALFRGVILGLLLRTVSAWPAQVFTAVFYSLVHFLKPPGGAEIPLAEVNAWSGFAVLGSMIRHLGEMNTFLAEFLTLLAVGGVLGHMRACTRSLWLPIGLHAGWVFALKWFASLSKNSRPLRAGEFLPWAGENVKVGLIPLAVILLTWALLAWRVKRRNYELRITNQE